MEIQQPCFQLWQRLSTMSLNIGSPLPAHTFKTAINRPILDVSAPPASNTTDVTGGILIGLTCTSASAVGKAEPDGCRVTLVNFQRTDTSLDDDHHTGRTLASCLPYAMLKAPQGGGCQVGDFDW